MTAGEKSRVRARGYAAKFRAETICYEGPKEPTDELFADMFARCCRVPSPSMYPAIRHEIENWEDA